MKNRKLVMCGLSIFGLPATAQVFAPGPSLPFLFDSVLDVPSPPPIGVSISGGVGGVAGQLTQLNINTNGSATNNFTAASGAEVNIDGGTVGNDFTALGGSEVNLLDGSIGLDFRTESNRVDIFGGDVGDGFIADIAAEVNLSGGSIRDNFQALAGSAVNISGG
ncbi:MAG: hypothetical protein MI744_18020, partial [Pseudomonadales bacterium]|nr:hypothetical protein [Pseudomonadales bacterium]